MLGTREIGRKSIEIRACEKCLKNGLNTLQSKQKASPWKVIHRGYCELTLGMEVPQGVLIRVDITNDQGVVISSSVTVLPFSSLIPKDKETYQLISTIEGDMTRMMTTAAKTTNEFMRKNGL